MNENGDGVVAVPGTPLRATVSFTVNVPPRVKVYSFGEPVARAEPSPKSQVYDVA